MDPNQIPDLRQYIESWSEDLKLLRQNNLLDKHALIRFVKDRGMAVSGVTIGDLDNFQKRGWLTPEGINYKGNPLFHPFRICPVYHNLKACQRNVTMLPDADSIGEATIEKSRVAADLAVLLEPAYWPHITGWRSRRDGLSETEYKLVLDEYRRKVLELIRTLEPNFWREVHESLRKDAARMENNSELYVLLRLSTWRQRKKLKGRISGALWIRHIAEVIRRAFEEVYPEQWPEEDQAFETWYPGGRKTAFGSERPFDDELQFKPYLAWEFGLFTGSIVRWYVEGETEYYAIIEILSEPSKVGVELVNLRGNIASESDNAALKLQDWLIEDRNLRRFSMISFDTDVPANVKAIWKQVAQNNVVGFIAVHKPDFEFANFAIEELSEVAARIDEASGVLGDAVRDADWTGVSRGRAFEKKYKAVSARSRGLKGEEWGRALARYAIEYPKRSDDGRERFFWREIQVALQARIADYDLQNERFGFDTETFEQIDIGATGTMPSTDKTGSAP